MASAEELIKRAESANNEAEIDQVEAEAENRATVMKAVEEARVRLANQQLQHGNPENAPRTPDDGPRGSASSEGSPSWQSGQQTGQDRSRQQSSGSQSGRGNVRTPEPVASADPGDRIPDALGNEPEQRMQQPADRTAVEVIDGEPAAVPSEDQEVGPAHQRVGEHEPLFHTHRVAFDLAVDRLA